MTRPRRHAPELIDAVRRCAKAGMTAEAAATHLTTAKRPLTRDAVIGLANRNGIKFGQRARVARPAPAVLPPKELKPQTGFGTVQARMAMKKPPAACSWLRCTNAALQGDMFCYQHGRRGLL